MHIPEELGMREFVSGVADKWRKLRIRANGSLGAVAWRSPILWLLLCGAFLIASIIVGTVITVGEFRESALRNSERELENTVVLLTHHFDQQFQDSDIIARNLASQMQFSEPASAELFKSRFSIFESHLELKANAGSLSYVGDVFIFDAKGTLINSSGSWPPPEMNVSDRDYFKAFKANPQLTMALEPVRSRLTGAWTTILAHRLSGPEGPFSGLWRESSTPSISKNTSPPSRWAAVLRFPCFIATGRCWRGTLMSIH
jgi:hypothetical protein